MAQAARRDRRKGDRHKPTEERKRDRHKARAKSDVVIAWDGESATVCAAPEYILLLSSENDCVESLTGLTTEECFACLLDSAARNPGALHVGFVFTYDANMILRDLPHAALKCLWDEGRVWWRGYWITFRQRKEFAIRCTQTNRKIRVWDVFGFFQASFVEALREWNVGTPEQWERIERMKERRADFDVQNMPEIRSYCREEVELLRALVRELRARAVDAGVTLKRFDGAGAVASDMFATRGVKAYKQRQPRAVERAAQRAYFGGRIETVRFGSTHGKVYGHDLRSAYPDAMQHAPCLACATWEPFGRGRWHGDAFALYHIDWRLTGNVLPFPWRDRYGAVYFPRSGRGWYWQPELAAAFAAIKRGIIRGRIDLIESYVATIGCDHKPFSWIPEVYEQRARWKAEGVGAQRVLKLGLNSLYGKCAQRLGGKYKPPPWHQIEWSGWVTSTVRAALYRTSFPAIEERSLIFYATDAIVAEQRLRVEETTRLGAWEVAEHDTATIVQSGVYWLGKDGDEIAHTRGFRRSELERDRVTQAWHARQWTLPHTVRRFMGMGLAIGARQGGWRSFREQERDLRLEPTGTKRALRAPLARINPATELVATDPADVTYWQRKTRESTPIKLPWETEENSFDPTEMFAGLNAHDESDDGWE